MLPPLIRDSMRRWPGCTDHHFLHYFVTAATALHVFYILDATARAEA